MRTFASAAVNNVTKALPYVMGSIYDGAVAQANLASQDFVCNLPGQAGENINQIYSGLCGQFVYQNVN